MITVISQRFWRANSFKSAPGVPPECPRTCHLSQNSFPKRSYAAAPQCVSAGVSVNSAKKAALALFTRVFTFTHCGAIHATSAPERVI